LYGVSILEMAASFLGDAHPHRSKTAHQTTRVNRMTVTPLIPIIKVTKNFSDDSHNKRNSVTRLYDQMFTVFLRQALRPAKQIERFTSWPKLGEYVKSGRNK
jgi:hypothetical protein